MASATAQSHAALIRRTLAAAPSSCYRVATDRFGDQMEQTDDYYIDWELTVVPTDLSGCSVHVILSIDGTNEPCWGLGFDRMDRVAQRFRARRLLGAPLVWAFGHEPIRMSSEDACAHIAAALRGEVLLRYRMAFGCLWGTSGVVKIKGQWQRPLGAPRLLGSKVYRYAPWHHSLAPPMA